MAAPKKKDINSELQEAPVAATENKNHFRLLQVKNFLLHTVKGRIVAGLLAAVLLFTLLCAVPVTRYAIAGIIIKKDISFVVQDVKTGKPISQAEVVIAGKATKTDAKGMVTLTGIPVGNYQVEVKKAYYKPYASTVNVPILRSFTAQTLAVEATGRQVPVKVVNKISGKPIVKAVITAADSSVTTDDKGEAVIVLPAQAAKVKSTVKATDYNDASVEVTVTEQPAADNTFNLVPTGKLLFLSKRTGKIDVMSSNLDGSGANVVLAGTGKEEEGTTLLLASRDWKYVALHARRDSGKAKMYLIDTATGKLTVMDEGDAHFELVGWHNESFIFTVNRNVKQRWDNKAQALKSFNAKTGKLSTLDETAGGGTNDYDYAYQNIESVYILEKELVYVKRWNYGFSFQAAQPQDKRHAIMTVQSNGQGKRVVKELAFYNGYIDAKLYEPAEVYYQVGRYDGSEPAYYEYENGAVKDVPNGDETFEKYYPTYLISPSGKQTFWYEPRDGKNSLFMGNEAGDDQSTVLSLSEYKPYGWFTDDYLLVSKGGSELYVMAAGENQKPLKITDYHKPRIEFTGYGYGYGGL